MAAPICQALAPPVAGRQDVRRTMPNSSNDEAIRTPSVPATKRGR